MIKILESRKFSDKIKNDKNTWKNEKSDIFHRKKNKNKMAIRSNWKKSFCFCMTRTYTYTCTYTNTQKRWQLSYIPWIQLSIIIIIIIKKGFSYFQLLIYVKCVCIMSHDKNDRYAVNVKNKSNRKKKKLFEKFSSN